MDERSAPAGCPLAGKLAHLLRESREELAHRWLERIAARVSIEPNRVFPTDELLNHVPLLIDGIASYMEDPSDEISADMPVIGKAMELGVLRFNQGFDAYEILKEYELLGGVLFHFVTSAVDSIDMPCSRGELLQCAHRIFHAVMVIQQVTATHYLRMLGERVNEREERLRGFNRMVSHELKNRTGAILGAHQMLQEDWVGPDQRAKFLAMIGENAEEVKVTLENLTSLSRLDAGARQQRNILLRQAGSEAVRQLRELARKQGVVVKLGSLPDVEVNAAAVELCLSNYVSNAIKYADPGKQERWVSITGELCDGSEPGQRELVVKVGDNGLGVPDAAQRKLFQRFFRAHEGTVTGIEGTGLGLSLVRETIETLGGRAWAVFPPEGGTVFAFALPMRRDEEKSSAV